MISPPCSWVQRTQKLRSPLLRTLELWKAISLKPGKNKASLTHCQEFLPWSSFYRIGLFNLFFPEPLLSFYVTAIVVAKTGFSVGPRNEIRQQPSDWCRFSCWVPADHKQGPKDAGLRHNSKLDTFLPFFSWRRTLFSFLFSLNKTSLPTEVKDNLIQFDSSHRLLVYLPIWLKKGVYPENVRMLCIA